MLDLDHFKRVNDELRARSRDEVLQGVATLIAGLLRASDTAYRYGGEELAVILRESDASAALRWPSGCASGSRPCSAAPGEIGVTASIRGRRPGAGVGHAVEPGRRGGRRPVRGQARGPQPRARGRAPDAA